MDSATLGEWSRYVVSGAVAAFIVAWLAYCAETAYRARSRRTAAPDEREVVAVGATQLHNGASPTAGVSSVGSTGSLQDGRATDGDGEPDAGDGVDPVRQMAGIGFSVSVLATLLLAAGVVMRAIGVSRAPWGNMYEFSITASLVAAVVFLAVARTKVGRALAVWIVLLIFLALGLAVTVLYLPPGPLAAALPASSTLDRLAYRLIAVGFPVWTFGPLIMGAIWAEASWGRYWGWDPKEVWALITWLAYAAFLHARATAGWKGSKASAVSLVAYGTVLFSYFGVNILFNGLHSYGGL